MAVSVGKAFEAELEGVFRDLKESHLLAWHRFPDTHSAGGGQVIQPQPSDYLLGLPPGSRLPLSGGPAGQRLLFVEAKASEKYEGLRKAAVSAEQRGFVHLYAGLLQLPYLIVHYSTLTGALQLWDGRGVVTPRLDPACLLAETVVGAGRKVHKPLATAMFVQFLCLPDKSKTVKMYKQPG